MDSNDHQMVESIPSDGTRTSSIVVGTCTSTSINESSATQLFKLNVDCFEHLFEWFSLTELIAFRCTCKRMKAVADYYIKLNYPQLLCFEMNDSNVVDLCQSRINYFEWIRHLYIWTSELNDSQIDGIKYILNQLETLKLCWVEISGDFYEVVLKHCPHLKYLGIRPRELPETIIGTGNQWLLRHYPCLEHFEIDRRLKFSEPFQSAPNLLAFFQHNPSIRRFSTDSEFLLMCRQSMLDSNLDFDQLDIYCRYDLSDILSLMNDLHQRGFYKELHIYSNHDSLSLDQAQYLLAFQNLRKLHLNVWPENCSIPKSDNIKDLSIGTHGVISLGAINQMIVKFPNLRRISIPFGYLRSFVCGAPKLRDIVIWDSYTENLTVDDIVAMNKGRSKMERAHKVILYIDENSFLKLKSIKKTNFSCIEIKRSEPREADHLFY